MTLKTFKYYLQQLFSKPKTFEKDLTSFFQNRLIDINKDQLKMIMSILNLYNKNTNSIKIPENKMITISENSSLKECTNLFIKSGHSRIPIYQEKDGKKNYTGILHAKSLLSINNKEQKMKISKFSRKIFIAPESQSLLSLLKDMKQKQKHMALTVNEFGEINGLITLEDILEEIVGEIKDEFDKEKQPIQKLSKNKYLIEGSTSLIEINEYTKINLPSDKFKTIAGYLLHELKGEVNQNSFIKINDITLKVKKLDDKYIESILLIIK